MSSIVNLFSNFDDLTKPKSIIDTPSKYTKNTKSNKNQTIALNQGNKFKKYQKKIVNNLERKINNVNSKEGFEGFEGFEGLNIDDKNLQLSKNGLTSQTKNIIRENDYSNKQQIINNLRQEYSDTLKQYEDLQAKLSGATSGYINRVSPNNPYLNKTIRFTTGHICYVTQQGIVKYIPSPEIWKSVKAPQNFTDVNLPWDPSYDTPGTTIPTNPSLISGTPMVLGQSLGNEGSNIFVDNLVDNPSQKYVGCYNDKPPATDIAFIPKMNSSNSVSGFNSYDSSTYLNNNDSFGPWCAFDKDINTFWHSYVGSSNGYDATTGNYTGSTAVPYVDSTNTSQTANGEYIQINLPNNITLTKYQIQGRQGCCGDPSGRSPNSWVILGWNGGNWVLVDQQNNQALNFEMKSYDVSSPGAYNAYIFLTTNCGNPGDRSGNRYCVQISEWSLITSSDYMFNDSDRAMIWNPSEIGYTDFDTCKSYAINNGFQYFSMQNGQSDGTAACLVSNDLARSQMYERAYEYTPTALWSSDTAGQTGNSAILDTIGSLSVVNSSGANVFSTDNSQAQPGNYLGCYRDSPVRAMPLANNGSQTYNYQTCQQAAQDGGFNYFGLQNSISGSNAQCGLTNDIGSATKYGKAGNCTKLSDGTWSGGGWSNSVYNNAGPDSNYFLLLLDNGSMSVYRGTSPSDNQGLIWTGTISGSIGKPNPNFAASKGKYGRNWMASGSTLSPGDFIGSNNGSCYLIMQTDGNLVLYTSTPVSECKKNSKGIDVGGSWVNAIYELIPSGFKTNIGKLAFIDENSELHAYSSDNSELTNNYRVFKSVNTPGNDIAGAEYGNATVEQCKSTCNNTEDCYGFVFDNANNICWPKTNSMYPYGGPYIPSSNNDIYVRGQRPISVPIGVKSDVNNVDSIQYQNYNVGDAVADSYGLKNATSVERQQLSQLQTKMDQLSSQINNLTTKFGTGSQDSQVQAHKNQQGLREYLGDIKKNTKEIENMSENMNNIVSDSDIVVLQKNYNYLFWTILATGTVLISMNMIKKQ